MQKAWQSGKIGEMEECRDKLAALHKALFVESSPAPVKYAASALGLCTDEVRLPLVPASQNCRTLLDEALALAGLENKQKKAA